MRRAFLVIASLCAACGAGVPTGTSPAATSLVVKRGGLVDRVVLTGEIEARASQVLVVPRTPSWAITIRTLVDDGAVVKKGHPLVEFDSSSLSAVLEDKRLAVLRAENELLSEMAKATADQSDKKIEVDRKRAAVEKASVEASVPSDLYPRRVFQEKQVALARERDALAKAEAELAGQRRAALLDRKLKEIARAQAVRELQEVEQKLEELVLRAPRDGLVQIAMNRRDGRKFQVGDTAWPGMEVVRQPDLGAMQVRARLADVDEGAVRTGMAAECVLDAYASRRFKAQVAQVSPVASPDGRDGTRRFFDVVLSLEQADSAIMLPGMSVRVEITRRQVDRALLVPRAAVRQREGRHVARLAGGKEEPIEIDFCAADACVLRAGLTEGAVLAGAHVGGPSS
jgi:HlyD family secretion protein